MTTNPPRAYGLLPRKDVSVISSDVLTLWVWDAEKDDWFPDPEWTRKPWDDVLDEFQRRIDSGTGEDLMRFDPRMHERVTTH